MDNASYIYSWSFHHPDLKRLDGFSIKDCFNIVTGFEKSLNLVPTMIGVNGKGYDNNKIVQFEKGLKQLEKNNFKSVESLSLYTNEPESIDFAFYWVMLVSVSISKVLGSHLYVGLAFELIENVAQVREELIKPLVDIVKPPYGYAYVSPVGSGPFGYSAGFIHTPDNDALSEDQKELITKWANNMDLISEGKLRDLYLENYLSDTQLKSEVDGLSLKKWIESDSQRGALTRFVDAIFLWIVPVGSYRDIREALNRNNLLIAYDKYVFPTILEPE
jgi:hypothetical protein